MHAGMIAGNGIHGNTYGAEFTANWQPIDPIRFQGIMSLLQYDLENAPDSTDAQSLAAYEGTSPSTQLGLRTMVDLTADLFLDINVHYMSRLPNPGIDSYTALDIRLGWTPYPGVELSVAGRDLLEAEHTEFPPSFLGGEFRRIPRSYYARINWSF